MINDEPVEFFCSYFSLTTEGETFATCGVLTVKQGAEEHPVLEVNSCFPDNCVSKNLVS